jgi:predicted PurR-regulated permease PerM
MNKKGMGVVGAVILLVIVGFALFIIGAIIIKNVNNKINNFKNNIGEIIMGEEENISIDVTKPDAIKGDTREELAKKINETDNKNILYS